MKLPRDLSGTELASLLRRYGYEVTRQTGSHLRLTSSVKEKQHHITIPGHKSLKVGTLSGILSDIASHLEIDRQPAEAGERTFRAVTFAPPSSSAPALPRVGARLLRAAGLFEEQSAWCGSGRAAIP